MKWDSYIPYDILKPFVKSMVIRETSESGTYMVLPDTGSVIGFQFRGWLSWIEEHTEKPLAISGISGLADQSRTFRNSPDVGSVLVYFKAAGAAPFFKQPLHEIFKESISLDNFMLRSELLCLEERLAEAKSDPKRIAAVEQFLIQRMSNSGPDELVLAALAMIHQSKGNIRIKDLAERLYSSQSPLEKRFRSAVGASPKKFAAIVRLRYAIQQYGSIRSLTELAYEAGFFDQVHFTKAFKTFTGDTPEDFCPDK